MKCKTKSFFSLFIRVSRLLYQCNVSQFKLQRINNENRPGGQTKCKSVFYKWEKRTERGTKQKKRGEHMNGLRKCAQFLYMSFFFFLCKTVHYFHRETSDMKWNKWNREKIYLCILYSFCLFPIFIINFNSLCERDLHQKPQL